jgi:hypothetical protein
MDLLHFTPAHVHPEIKVWGNRQTFSYETPASTLELNNQWAPLVNIPTITTLEWSNTGLNGFRLKHQTKQGDTTGTFEMLSFVNAEPNGTSLFLASPLEIVFNVVTKGKEPQTDSEFATKFYVDSHISTQLTLQGDVTGQGSLLNPIVTTFAPNPVFTGNAITVPSGDDSGRPTVLSVGMLRCNLA